MDVCFRRTSTYGTVNCAFEGLLFEVGILFIATERPFKVVSLYTDIRDYKYKVCQSIAEQCLDSRFINMQVYMLYIVCSYE